MVLILYRQPSRALYYTSLNHYSWDMSKKTLWVGVILVFLIIGFGVYSVSKKASPAMPYDSAGSDQYTAAILACYPKSSTGVEDTPIPNNSIQYVKETSRMFINMPKDLYPQDLQSSWTTVAGNATAGSVGGGFGESVAATPSCWSSYMDFEGSGEVDLRVKSVVEGAPDYFVRFIVSP